MKPRAAAWVVAACLMAAAAGRATNQDNDLSARALVSRAASYVSEYQQRLTAVVADEEYTQEILAQVPVDPDMPRTRRLRSEVFFVFEPVDRQWMAIRDTMLVDGQPVRDKISARKAFETLSPWEVRRRFSEFNSRWNLGRITRNFNEPTLALLVFDPEHKARFTFDRRHVSRAPEAVLATLEFRERERPTLIRDLSLGPVFSRGEIVMEAGGAIRSTTFRVALEDVGVELTTDYAMNEKLGMRVPSVFRERYERGRQGTQRYERIACEAFYTNYRRFDVLTRVK